jgi:hypothetical protein
MPQKQNPADEGRVLWNALVGASTESFSLSAIHAQHLIAICGLRAEPVVMLTALAWGGRGNG